MPNTCSFVALYVQAVLQYLWKGAEIDNDKLRLELCLLRYVVLIFTDKRSCFISRRQWQLYAAQQRGTSSERMQLSLPVQSRPSYSVKWWSSWTAGDYKAESALEPGVMLIQAGIPLWNCNVLYSRCLAEHPNGYICRTACFVSVWPCMRFCTTRQYCKQSQDGLNFTCHTAALFGRIR